VVYSITDKQSFEYAMEALENFQKLRPVSAVPVTLLANKADLEHLREVSVPPTSCKVRNEMSVTKLLKAVP
jgi:hypothetical protein